jgi:hypothetical protein
MNRHRRHHEQQQDRETLGATVAAAVREKRTGDCRLHCPRCAQSFVQMLELLDHECAATQ